MLDEFENPEEELIKLNRVIRQYEIIFKTTGNEYQKIRVSKKLKELRDYKEKVLTTFDINENALIQEDEDDFFIKDFNFLDEIINKYSDDSIAEHEIYYVDAYLRFFYNEILIVLSERSIKLDFKYSLDRDNFYHKFQDLLRRLDDYKQELIRIEEGMYGKNQELEMRKRNLKRRRFIEIEADRFFKSLEAFTEDLVQDIEQNGSKCLNSSEDIYFDKIEGKRYLSDYKVSDAIVVINDFAKEVISYLNIPDIGGEQQE